MLERLVSILYDLGSLVIGPGFGEYKHLIVQVGTLSILFYILYYFPNEISPERFVRLIQFLVLYLGKIQ